MLSAFLPLRSPGAPGGFSSAGRALAWHARGQGFESPKLHSRSDSIFRVLCARVPEVRGHVGGHSVARVASSVPTVPPGWRVRTLCVTRVNSVVASLRLSCVPAGQPGRGEADGLVPEPDRRSEVPAFALCRARGLAKGFHVSGAACATRPGSLPGWPCSRSSAWRSRHHGQAGAQPAGERRPGLAARHRRQHDLVPGHGGRGDGPGPAPRAGRRDGAVRDRVRDDFAHGVWAGKLVAALAVVSGIGALNGWTLVTPEVSRAAASDRLFPRAFAWIDRKDRPRSRSNWPPLTCRKQVVLRADAGIQLVDGDTGRERHVLQLGLAAASAPNQIGPTAHFGAHAKCSGFRDLSSFGSREKPESADARRPRPNRQRRDDGC